MVLLPFLFERDETMPATPVTAKTTPAQGANAAENVTDVDVMIPTIKTINTSQGPVEIRPLKTRQVKEAMKHVVLIRGALGKDIKKLDVADLLTEHADTVVALAAIMTDKPVEFMDELNADEAVTVVTAVLEENLDFFIQKVLPALTALVEKITEGMQKAVTGQTGQTPSSS